MSLDYMLFEYNNIPEFNFRNIFVYTFSIFIMLAVKLSTLATIQGFLFYLKIFKTKTKYQPQVGLKYMNKIIKMPC